MSQELERVYTINLGKVKLSQSQHRAVRAINMIKEFARHHMKVEEIKIEEELAHQVWARGVRRPPRKIRVRMTKTDDGYILVSQYDEEAESKVSSEKDTKKVEDKVEEPSTEAKEVEDKVEEPSTEAKEVEDKVEEPSTEAKEVEDKVEEPSTEAKEVEDKVEEPSTEAPKKEKPSKEAPKKKS
ncbi:MAG: 50S ribosomal protein L31 [Candidatus Nitrosopumilus sp. MTA1]|uniref:Large ribosomal subunit protein eL31 n=2 Tax=Marine Group I thaumarchaeote TaxID=2511932 RepID=A0A7K4P1P4_9ARCH|nr:50S ribosomal protein L31 [Candidatus Nitrosopumilus sp. MTA1]NWK09091.1 60S ribosomal protein L31 [Marine Group I thaumarchaeote]